MTKIYDLAVKVSEYTNRQGETKGKWQNVGAVMQKDDGSKMILLDRYFNPAGVPNPENRSNVILSMFTPRQQGAGNAGGGNSAPDQDDDIPF